MAKGDLRIEMTVNGSPIRAEAPSHTLLVDFLRDHLGLTGTKKGCGEGECGTCTVIMDGEPVKSCLIPVAKAQGSSIVTVEGLAEGDKMHPLQEAFLEAGAVQCGFCTPGMLMAAKALLDRNPRPDDGEIKAALSGNLCRCTGYSKIIEAVHRAAEKTNGAAKAEEAGAETALSSSGSWIGQRVPRVDGGPKVSGSARYAADLKIPGMLHAKVLRSPHAHARIRRVEIGAARNLPGVEAVLTGEDIGFRGYGVYFKDQPILCTDKVRFVGDAVALVAATSEEIAERALELIHVDYEVLPAVFDPVAAMGADSPLIHPSGNLVKHARVRKGDVETGMRDSDVVVEETYRTQWAEHAYMEPEAAVAYLEPDGTLTVLAPGQNLTHQRANLAEALGLPVHKVRMIQTVTGGGFGGKEDLTVQPYAAILALRTGKPVRIVYSREESFVTTTKRHPYQIKYRTGARRDGTLTAVSIEIIADGGAYACSSPGVVLKASLVGPGPYRIPNLSVDAFAVYTNNTPSGAMRGFGVPQIAFATECQMDLVAERLGLSPVEIRRRNVFVDGSTTHTGQVLARSFADETLRKVLEAGVWTSDPRSRCSVKKRGRGIACSWYGIGRTGTPDCASAMVEIDDGGTVKILTGVTEIGEGVTTALAQIAAEEIGVRIDDVVFGDNDTARVPEAAHAGASRQTYVIGNAVKIAAREAKRSLYQEAARLLEIPEDKVRGRDRRLVSEDDSSRSVDITQVIRSCRRQGILAVGSGYWTAPATPVDPDTGQGSPWSTYVFAAHAAEVEVDTDTGEVKVLQVVAAHDVGRAINPTLVEGQIEGGAVMGQGYALMEEFVLSDGVATTPGFAKYILPTTMDVPDIKSILVEEQEPKGPFGAKGIGEAVSIPTAPAILNAIYDAIGVRFTSLPVTPERVLLALKKSPPGPEKE